MFLSSLSNSQTKGVLNPFCLIIINLSLSISSIELKESSLINGNFSSSASLIQGIAQTYFPLTIPGWSCRKFCQLLNCGISYQLDPTNFPNCSGFTIDLNSDNTNEIVTQLFTVEAGIFHIFATYYYPYANWIDKTLKVYLNDQIIFVSGYHMNIYGQFYVDQQHFLLHGVNNLTFTETGFLGDWQGYKLNNISVRRHISPSDENTFNVTLNHEFLSSLIGIPSIRIVIAQFMNFLMNFDRLKFYHLHNRNHSYYFLILLQNINSLLEEKDTFVQKQVIKVIPQPLAEEQTFLNSLDFKTNYTDFRLLQSLSSSTSLLANFKDIIIYWIPIVFSLYLIFVIIFKITFKIKLSIIFRKYSFYGIIIYMVFEGIVQDLTFYTFSQFGCFFSASIIHKTVNFLIIILYFIVLFTAFGSFLWFRSWYGRKGIYLVQNCKGSLTGIVCSLVDRGLICFMFGAAHQLFMSNPDLQLFVLAIIEVVWFSSRWYFLVRNSYDSKLPIFLGMLSGINRMLFQVNSYIYAHTADCKVQHYQNNQIHLRILYSFIGVWILEFLVACGILCKDIIKTFLFILVNPTQDYLQSAPSHDQNQLDAFERTITPSNGEKVIEECNKSHNIVISAINSNKTYQDSILF